MENDLHAITLNRSSILAVFTSIQGVLEIDLAGESRHPEFVRDVVTLRFLSVEVPVSVTTLMDKLQEVVGRLAAVACHHLVDLLVESIDFLRVSLDLFDLPESTARNIVNHERSIRIHVSHALGTEAEEKSSAAHRLTLYDRSDRDTRSLDGSDHSHESVDLTSVAIDHHGDDRLTRVLGSTHEIRKLLCGVLVELIDPDDDRVNLELDCLDMIGNVRDEIHCIPRLC